jgi:hypothetical protein
MISKGNLMKLVYGENYTGIDSAIPVGLWGSIETSIHVINYNDGGWGRLENIIKVGMLKGANIPKDVIKAEYNKCCEDEEYFYNNYCRNEGDPWYTPEVFKEYQSKINTRYREPQHAFPKDVKEYPLTVEDYIKDYE